MVIQNSFYRVVRSFLNKIFEKPSSTSEPIEPKRIVLFTLPFSGLHSVQIRNQINKLFSSAYTHIQIRCIFRPMAMQRLSTFFRIIIFHKRIFIFLQGGQVPILLSRFPLRAPPLEQRQNKA